MQHPCASLCSVSWAQPHWLGFGPQSLGQPELPQLSSVQGWAVVLGCTFPAEGREGGDGVCLSVPAVPRAVPTMGASTSAQSWPPGWLWVISSRR